MKDRATIERPKAGVHRRDFLRGSGAAAAATALAGGGGLATAQEDAPRTFSAGLHKITITVKDGMRHYETADGHVALPEESPVLQSKFQYAFETRPSAYLAPVQWELHKLTIKRDRTIQALRTRPWWQPIGAIQEPGPDGTPQKRICSTAALQDELWQLDAAIVDTQHELQRLSMGV